VELYYGFSEGMLTYRKDADKLKGEIVFNLEIRDSVRVVAKKEWFVPHILSQPEKLETPQTLVGMQSLNLPLGEYLIILKAFDQNEPTRSDSLQYPLHITTYPNDQEFFSDIEFCNSIQSSADTNSLFYKNTLEVVPNPSRLYGTGLPIMYYYVIAYNLLSRDKQTNFIVRTAVYDASGKEIITKDKTKPRLYNSSVEIGTINLSAVRTGTYLFRVSLLDTSKTLITEVSKKFFVYKYGSMPDTSVNIPDVTFNESKYAVMPEEEINKYFEYANYISSDYEKQQFEQLHELKAKQKFLFDFWQKRKIGNPDLVGDENYYSRIKSANELFSSSFQDGWKTDRGRVYVIYGPYDEIERYPSSTESNPYEIWHYNNIQGGVIFVFVDREGLGNYQLVHSTHRNELHEEMWYERYAMKIH